MLHYLLLPPCLYPVILIEVGSISPLKYFNLFELVIVCVCVWFWGSARTFVFHFTTPTSTVLGSQFASTGSSGVLQCTVCPEINSFQ